MEIAGKLILPTNRQMDRWTHAGKT